MNFSTERQFALDCDTDDSLAHIRQKFSIPEREDGSSVIYFSGNSLGLSPKSASDFVFKEMDSWAAKGVLGHNRWRPFHENLTESTARLVGSKSDEVVVMNALTVNLHLLMVSFYSPTKSRYKIVIEKGAFPSDRYAVESQIIFHGFDPETSIVEIGPRKNEHTIRHEDIKSYLEEEGESVALIMFGGVNYYTGQVFDIKSITQLAHGAGAVVGYDLAHGVGNIPLELHHWDVDFAAWCSYKYLCGGPGCPGGIFVHEKYKNFQGNRFAGWWGQNKETRFLMEPEFTPITGAEGWQISNPPVFSMASLMASMEIIDLAGMHAMREKSERLTGYLEFLLAEFTPEVEILTPGNASERGCQLSISIPKNGREIFNALRASGYIVDWREPQVIRVAPKPLYNTFAEVWDFADKLKSLM